MIEVLPMEALEMIKRKLRNDDIAVLNYLRNRGMDNPRNGLSKDIIQKDTSLTSACTSNSLIRLEVACLIERQAFEKPQKFYITESGKQMLTLF